MSFSEHRGRAGVVIRVEAALRCDNGSCMDRGEHYVDILDIHGGGPHSIGLCCGCYLRVLRQRRRAGHVRPWPLEPIPNDEFWGYFKGWEIEPTYPNDEYMKHMEESCWKGR